jgi:hypothetical protein
MSTTSPTNHPDLRTPHGALKPAESHPELRRVSRGSSRLAAGRLLAAGFLASLGGLFVLATAAGAATRYVDVNNAAPAPPYTTWATAATNIQDAVDVAVAGEEILVTNGVYQTGAREVYGMSNRVAVTKPVTVRSVNGPAVTQIVGYQVPGTRNGPEAVRCVYLTNGAVLAGFTLTNGATQAAGDYDKQQSGGGVWCEGLSAVVSNCVLMGNSAGGSGGGAYEGTLNNCALTGNSAPSGGGAAGRGVNFCSLNNCAFTGNSAYDGGGATSGTLNNCTLAGNSAGNYGGGVSGGTLNHCTLTGNSADEGGGGVHGGTLSHCTLAGNSASSGGGASWCMLDHCVLTGNSASSDGGGAYGGTLNNCALTRNSAGASGGGAYGIYDYYGDYDWPIRYLSTTLNNCTLVGNSASSGGGAYQVTLTNCIVYYNRALVDGPNYLESPLSYSCTTPRPASGTGNLAEEPQLASTSHLSAGSPCIGRGSATSASGGDLDGEPWGNPPAMGCDEYWSGSVTGAFSVAVVAAYTNVAVGFAVDFQAVIEGRVSASRWDFGDGMVVSNRPWASHAWAAAGDYVVELRAYNETYPAGVATTVTVQVVLEEHYVALASTNPVPPYDSWATAATNIHDAVDAATLPGALVWVNDGVYETGARVVDGMSNRVAVTKPVTVRSVNGPAVTHIVGYQVPGATNGPAAVRCVYLTNGAALAGFTLTNGATQTSGDYYRNRSGGGVWCEGPSAAVSNCVLTGNSASYGGGGAYEGTLNHCALTGNSASSGGGASGGTLNNCLLTNNSASLGGGVSGAGLYNCTLTGNSASSGGGASGGTLNHCTLTGNSASSGGGASGSTLNHCTLADNSAFSGGGAQESTLNDCTLTGNSASNEGGGAYRGTLSNCALTGNSASWGGGANEATLNTCTLAGNSAENGGGATRSTLNNCALTGNLGNQGGGGAWGSTLSNCTLTDNSADYGGGAFWSSLNNCIVYFNRAHKDGPNYSGPSPLNYCCTTPLPPLGNGSITADPQLASSSHLRADSPCRSAGSAAYAQGVDIDGEPWGSPPSIGCDEYWSGSVTGALSVAVVAAYTNVTVGFAVDFQAVIGGRVSASRWDFGDGLVVSNRLWAAHAWAVAGDYAVELRAYNETYPAGVATTVAVRVVDQPVHYVALTSTNPVPPYDSWATAATNIQDAVDAAIPGALVWVHDGVYQTGARSVYGSNRVAVTRPMMVRSVNGPANTIIRGYQVPGTACGPEAVRCVYLASGAALAGFTLTNGATQTAGDYSKNRSGGGVWCEGPSAVVSNCVLTGNTAAWGGGGASGGTLNNCAHTGNSASSGGGASGSTLNNCTLTGNIASSGGGASGGTLNNCTLTGNSAVSGDRAGGGAYQGTLNHCTLTGNSAGRYGGGVFEGTLNHCTLTGNSAEEGGGASGGTLNNCIVYYNRALSNGPNYRGGTLHYCCTTPLAAGPGNLDAEPQLASSSHLSATSPCRGAGSAAYASGTDIDGEAWGNPPAIGCDEYWSGSVAGAMSVAVVAAYTNVAVGFAVDFQAVIEGRVSASRWDFGDGMVVSNRPWASHAWAAAGDYVVELRAYNENNPGGVMATVTVQVVLEEHYVALASTNPVPPYSNWATAARSIQDAVDATTLPGALVWVNDGVYQNGARELDGMSNRVALTKPVTVRSVNGPAATQIVGYQVPGATNGPAAVRCVYLTSGAALAGFTLTNGATQTSGDFFRNRSGGGVWCEGPSAVVSNCVLTGNSASSSGGGAYGGTLNHCTLRGNSAYWGGGGESQGTLNHCTLVGNSAPSGGGASGGTLNNCTLTGNRANGSPSEGSGAGGGASGGTLNHCTLAGNSADDSGGGAYAATLNNCVLTGNTAENYGGGACFGMLNNCTLTGNSAAAGGGAYGGSLNNCIVYYNRCFYDGPNYLQSTLNYCCTSPLPGGPGNITNAPLFMDPDGWRNLRLYGNSPGVNAGTNAYAPGSTDLDGNPRIFRGTVDLGAYESQTSWIWHPLFGALWDSGNGWYGGSAYGWMWFDAGGHWIWSTRLQGWMGFTDPTSRTLWSVQFRWLTPAAPGSSLAFTSTLGPVQVGVYHGTLLPDGSPITDGWVVSDRFGYVWAAGDGVWFYTTGYGWLGVTPDGGIWSINEGRFL